MRRPRSAGRALDRRLTSFLIYDVVFTAEVVAKQPEESLTLVKPDAKSCRFFAGRSGEVRRGDDDCLSEVSMRDRAYDFPDCADINPVVGWLRLACIATRPSDFDLYGVAQHVPEVNDAIARGLQDGRLAWAQLLHGIDPHAEPRKAQAVGSVHQALLTGVLVQWLTDPQHAPTADDLTTALRAIADDIHTS
jgi:hypothetical protein